MLRSVCICASGRPPGFHKDLRAGEYVTAEDQEDEEEEDPKLMSAKEDDNEREDLIIMETKIS